MCTKLSKAMGLFHRLKQNLPEEIMKKLYYSLIQPYTNYGFECWYGASRSSTSGVHALQKKAIRPVFNLDYYAHTNENFQRNFNA